MKDTYQSVSDLIGKAAGAKSALEALQYSQAAFNAANALARAEEASQQGNVRGGAGS